MKKRYSIPLVILLILAVLAGSAYFVFHHYVSMLNRVPLGGDAEAVLSDATAQGSGELEDDLPDDADAPEAERPAEAVPEDAAQPVTEILEESGLITAGVRNILLIGVDNDYLPGMKQLGNADGLIIASINENSKKIVLSSIMRDTYVRSALRNAGTKITLIYHEEGTNGLVRAVEKNFQVPIDNYVLVNYINVVDIIDALGGMELELTKDEIIYMAEKIQSVNLLVGQKAGANKISVKEAGKPLLLNGVQVAAYLRVRLAGDGDAERTERARRVLNGCFEKMKGLSLSEYNKMAQTILPCITTDLDEGDILSILMNGRSYLRYSRESLRIPIDESFTSTGKKNGSMLMIDYEMNREYLHTAIYG